MYGTIVPRQLWQFQRARCSRVQRFHFISAIVIENVIIAQTDFTRRVNRWEILFYEGFKWNKKINRSIDRTWIGGNRICAVFALREMSEARLSIYGPPVEDPSTKQTSFRIFWIVCLFCHSRARVKDVLKTEFTRIGLPIQLDVQRSRWQKFNTSESNNACNLSQSPVRLIDRVTCKRAA